MCFLQSQEDNKQQIGLIPKGRSCSDLSRAMMCACESQLNQTLWEFIVAQNECKFNQSLHYHYFYSSLQLFTVLSSIIIIQFRPNLKSQVN